MQIPYDDNLALRVKAESLEPRQRSTAVRLEVATDYSEQCMLKHPYLSAFHCYAEHLHAGLLEGEPHVISYTPQPFRLSVNGKWYTPDCHIVWDNRPQEVVELKPRGEMPEEKRIPLEHFFAQYQMAFSVVSNESIFAREMEAENWLQIVQTLYQARLIDTAGAEHALHERLIQLGICQLGDVIDSGYRERTYQQEIALLRLLHRGVVHANLSDAVLDLDTELWL
jgi:hypothetical protein